MKSLGAAVFALAASVFVAAQSPAVNITIARADCRASVRAEKTEPYAGGPWAAIPASCMNDSPSDNGERFQNSCVAGSWSNEGRCVRRRAGRHGLQ